MTAQPDRAAQHDPPVLADSPAPSDPWPHGISRRATMRISDVLAALTPEFESVSHSKLRFLEEQGLVTPVRTPAGYRQYSPADVERLRYVLRQQRDRYLPLRVIREQLAALDAGEADEPPTPRLATRDGEVARSGGDRLSFAALAEHAGLDESFVVDLVASGILTTGAHGQFDASATEIVSVAAALAEHGIDARHLRSFRQAADRQVDVVDQAVAPLRSRQSPSARAHSATVAAEVGELCVRLHAALIRAGVAGLD